MTDSPMQGLLRGQRALFQRVAMMAIAAVLSSGCASTQVKSSPDPLAELEQRATQRWQHLIDGDYGGAYEYLTHGYRQTRSRGDYTRLAASRSQFRWKTVGWKGAECTSEDSCLATLEVTYEILMPGGGPAFSVFYSKERWLRQQGVWQHLPEQ